MSTRTISIRVSDDDLAEIDQRVAAAGSTRTGFLLRAALGAITQDEQHLEEIERRLEYVERALSLR